MVNTRKLIGVTVVAWGEANFGIYTPLSGDWVDGTKEYYAADWFDSEGIRGSNICRWRDRNVKRQLSRNSGGGLLEGEHMNRKEFHDRLRKQRDERHSKRYALYLEGLLDNEIAQRQSVCTTIVTAWRVSHGLAPWPGDIHRDIRWFPGGVWYCHNGYYWWSQLRMWGLSHAEVDAALSYFKHGFVLRKFACIGRPVCTVRTGAQYDEVSALVEMLYGGGATDQEIGDIVRFPKNAIIKWRTTNRLRAHVRRKRGFTVPHRPACEAIYKFADEARSRSDPESLFMDPEATKRVLGFTCARLERELKAKEESANEPGR